MMGQMHFEIAGVGFWTSYPRIPELQEPAWGYPPEFKRTNGNGLISDIHIRLELTSIPKHEGITKLCDSGQTWSIFLDGEGYALSYDLARNGGTPLWMARFNRDCTQVTIHCSEKFMVEKDGRTTRLNPVGYPLDQILLMYHLAGREGALLHAAGVDILGKGFIFPGKSGAGKSTLVRQLNCRENIQILSDDRIVVRKIDNAYEAFGTPWPGEAGIARNTSMSLYGILFIRHGPINKIRSISPQEALARLMPVTSIPWYDEKILPPVLGYCEELVMNIPAFELEFCPGREVAECLERFCETFFSV
jgi:hypothetical protein